MYPVRFLKLAAHLRQQMVDRDADIYRKSKFPVDPVLEPCGKSHRICLRFLDAGHVHPRFVDAVLLNQRCVFVEHADQLVGFSHV